MSLPLALPPTPATHRARRYALSVLLALGCGLGLGSSQVASASADEDIRPMRTLDDTASFARLAASPETHQTSGSDDSWAALADRRDDDATEHDDDREDWQADEEVHPDWHEDRHHEDHHHEHEHTLPVPEADSYALMLLGLLALLGLRAFNRRG